MRCLLVLVGWELKILQVVTLDHRLARYVPYAFVSFPNQQIYIGHVLCLDRYIQIHQTRSPSFRGGGS